MHLLKSELKEEGWMRNWDIVRRYNNVMYVPSPSFVDCSFHLSELKEKKDEV